MIALPLALRAHWRLAGEALLVVIITITFALYKGEQRHSAKLQTQLTASEEGRRQDRASYQNAQAAAKAMNEAEVATIEAKQEEVTHDVSQDYAGDLARLRGELGRMRKTTPSASSPARSAQASSVPKPAESSGQAAGVPLSPSDVLRAAELELQLDSLITWVEDQAKVGR